MARSTNPRAASAKTRAKRVLAALVEHFEFDEADAAAALTDLLADARHFCDRFGLCYGDLDRTAHRHYLAELEEDGRVT